MCANSMTASISKQKRLEHTKYVLTCLFELIHSNRCRAIMFRFLLLCRCASRTNSAHFRTRSSISIGWSATRSLCCQTWTNISVPCHL
jgi:hypothetical protein